MKTYLSLLLVDISVRSLPHKEVFNNILHRLPGQVASLDLVEILPAFLYCLGR